jgi:hypothetical protein
MSELTERIYKHSKSRGSARAALLALASASPQSGSECEGFVVQIGFAELAAKTGVCLRQIKRVVHQLEDDLKEIKVTRKQGRNRLPLIELTVCQEKGDTDVTFFNAKGDTGDTHSEEKGDTDVTNSEPEKVTSVSPLNEAQDLQKRNLDLNKLTPSLTNFVGSTAPDGGGESENSSQAAKENSDESPPDPPPNEEKKTAEQKPKPRNPRPDRGTRIPDPFILTAEMQAWSRKNTPLVDAKAATAEFVDHWRGVPGSKGKKTDWLATWRNRMRALQEKREKDLKWDKNRQTPRNGGSNDRQNGRPKLNAEDVESGIYDHLKPAINIADFDEADDASITAEASG